MQVVAIRPQLPALCAEVLQQLGTSVFYDPSLACDLGRVAPAMLAWAGSQIEDASSEAAAAKAQVGSLVVIKVLYASSVVSTKD